MRMTDKKEASTPKEKKSADFLFDSQKIPTDAGCYLFKDKDGHILYVGKAKNLRKRVSNYFQKNKKAPKTLSLVKKIRDIETRIVSTEMEALILENNLIKEHLPKYNVLLRDDKTFLYLRITKEEQPKLEITRRLVRDGSTYIGPRTSAKSFRKTIAFCQKFFGAKMVNASQDNYIARLKGAKMSVDEYQVNIKRMIKFLRGDTKEVLKELQEKMMDFAKERNFEAAAQTRDLIESIGGSAIRQTVEMQDVVARDFLSFVRDNSTIFLARLVFRNGKFIDQNEIKLRAEEWQDDAKIYADFLLRFYPCVDHLPKEIILPTEIEDAEKIAEYLESNNHENQGKLEIKVAQKGDKKRILEIAETNAKNFCEKTRIEALSKATTFAKALPELAEKLNVQSTLKRIECYDISHFNGQETVASQVVFLDGAAKNSEYRRYKLKTIAPGEIDDFKSMNEVLTRRFKQLEEKKSADFFKAAPVTTKKEKEIVFDIIQTAFQNENEAPCVTEEKHFDEDQYKVVAVKQNDQIIGGLRTRKFEGKSWHISVLGIHPDFQNKGAGKILLEAFTKFIRAEGGTKIRLLANEKALSFYEKYGFLAPQKITKKFQKHIDLRTAELAENNISITPLEYKISKKSAEKSHLPDLIVIDGGKGQLSSVLKVFKEHPELIPPKFDPETQIIALAKREEEVFRGTNLEQIFIDNDSAASHLLQRIRDEAHRFAISYNRNLRSKSLKKSILDEINGIGPKTKKELLHTFESVSGIRNADDEELLKIVNQKQLNSLRKQL